MLKQEMEGVNSNKTSFSNATPSTENKRVGFYLPAYLVGPLVIIVLLIGVILGSILSYSLLRMSLINKPAPRFHESRMNENPSSSIASHTPTPIHMFIPTLPPYTGKDITIDDIPYDQFFLESQTVKETSEYVFPTMPPPLAHIEFPLGGTSYPSEYPDEIRLPDQFIPVEIDAKNLPEYDTEGWSVSFRYKGNLKNAADQLASFLVVSRWAAERIDLDTGGYMLLIEKDNKRITGAIILAPDRKDDPKNTLLLLQIGFHSS